MDRETTELVKKFTKKVKQKFKPKKIILFGSRAREDNLKESDYDFIIVSDKFEGMPIFKRMSLFYDYWESSADLEVICYTPKEFERKKKQIGIVQQAVKEGIEI